MIKSPYLRIVQCDEDERVVWRDHNVSGEDGSIEAYDVLGLALSLVLQLHVSAERSAEYYLYFLTHANFFLSFQGLLCGV